jgi:hypothetical protein
MQFRLPSYVTLCDQRCLPLDDPYPPICTPVHRS